MSGLRRPVGSDDWVKGPSDAPTTLLEYGDFECPFCGKAFGEVKKLERELGDKLRFVFRPFPLTQSHPHAMLAAEAAEAAGAQGKFWEMHDTLFRNQKDLEDPDLLGYAADLELDQHQFSRDLHQHKYQPKVRREFLEGARSGVNGTPTFFINGELYTGPATYEALLAAIEGRPGHEVETMTGRPS